MGFSGTQPGAAPAAIESAHRSAMTRARFAVVQKQGEHVTELGRYHDKVVAKEALEELVAKGFARDELSVRKIEG